MRFEQVQSVSIYIRAYVCIFCMMPLERRRKMTEVQRAIYLVPWPAVFGRHIDPSSLSSLPVPTPKITSYAFVDDPTGTANRLPRLEVILRQLLMLLLLTSSAATFIHVEAVPVIYRLALAETEHLHGAVGLGLERGHALCWEWQPEGGLHLHRVHLCEGIAVVHAIL